MKWRERAVLCYWGLQMWLQIPLCRSSSTCPWRLWYTAAAQSECSLFCSIQDWGKATLNLQNLWTNCGGSRNQKNRFSPLFFSSLKPPEYTSEGHHSSAAPPTGWQTGSSCSVKSRAELHPAVPHSSEQDAAGRRMSSQVSNHQIWSPNAFYEKFCVQSGVLNK